MPSPSAVGSTLASSSRNVSITPFGRSLVPEVNKMQASFCGRVLARVMSVGSQAATDW